MFYSYKFCFFIFTIFIILLLSWVTQGDFIPSSFLILKKTVFTFLTKILETPNWCLHFFFPFFLAQFSEKWKQKNIVQTCFYPCTHNLGKELPKRERWFMDLWCYAQSLSFISLYIFVQILSYPVNVQFYQLNPRSCSLIRELILERT